MPHQPIHPTPASRRQAQLHATLSLLMFGLVILGFLVAIDHPQWFHMRPATGTSIALSHAAASGAGEIARLH